MIPAFLALALLAQDPPALAPDQIAWQRSLDDARAIAAAEGRPLLVAVNVDGESASDRIVTERYRDPEFVAWTRRFACVIGHPYRHTARDHDENGRRIPCPRLGSVTCGEHVAIEPAIFDAYLGGERVSPRHALILGDGTKAFDLFLLFDLGVLDEALKQAAAVAPPDRTGEAWFDAERGFDAMLDAIAGARASWRRELLERRFADALAGPPDAHCIPVPDLVRAVARAGDAGSVDALRLVLQADAAPDASTLAAIEEAARARGFQTAYAFALHGILTSPGRYPGSPSLGADRPLLASFARNAGEHPALRSLVVAQAALGDPSDHATARAALRDAFGAESSARIEAAIAAEGGAVHVEDLLRLGAELHTAASAAPTRTRAAPESVRSADELAEELAAAERALAGHESEGPPAKRFGLANLKLAQARIASGGPDIGLLLQDADAWLAKAAAALPDDDLLALERARCAYYLSRFDEEARIANDVLTRTRARAKSDDAASAVVARWPAWGSGAASARAEVADAAALAGDDVAAEALRWVGDAQGQLLGRDVDDPVRYAAGLVRGARALASACAGREAQPVDFQSLASFLRAAWMTRPSLLALRAGLERFPDAQVLRDLARDVTAKQHGRGDVLCATADWLAARQPDSGACAWYAGYAWYLRAEDARRAQRPDDAVRDYDTATSRFGTSVALEPAYADSAGHYLAAAELGRGFAHRAAGRKQAAADALARALALRPAIGDARDGLDREALDLVDTVLEWTAEGPSPVDTEQVAEALASAVPGETRWLLAVADTALREGLRADGRGRATIPTRQSLRAPGGPDAALAPSAEGDRWLEESIAIARRAFALTDDAATRRALAQSSTVHAERLLARGRDGEAEPLLRNAAELLQEPPREDEGLAALARRLRARLGEARPVARPGR